jgi:5S rRNA maturation endonuclease (ribonuclease M5)
LTGQSFLILAEGRPKVPIKCELISKEVNWKRKVLHLPAVGCEAGRLHFAEPLATQLFRGHQIGRSISKGSSSSPAPIRPLPFSLRLSWHPYLDHRGVHPATAAKFGVGYYAGPGFLRGRIAFPIHDSEGRLVAYAGRSIDDSEPRYLFSPGFRKSQVVFNLHRAGAAAASRAAGCVIVEGFFDCLRLHQAGYRKVIALMGANLSEMQETLLLASFREVVLMLDGDEAGRCATRRVAARLRGRISLHIAEVPSGRQPDQLSTKSNKFCPEGAGLSEHETNMRTRSQFRFGGSAQESDNLPERPAFSEKRPLVSLGG